MAALVLFLSASYAVAADDKVYDLVPGPHGDFWLESYLVIKDFLTGPQRGAVWKLFDEMPLPRMRLKLRAAIPAEKPVILQLSRPGGAGVEVTVLLDEPFPSLIPVGERVIFSGRAKSYEVNPFHLTVEHGRVHRPVPMGSAPPTIEFSIDKEFICRGESAVLRWKTTNARRVWLEPLRRRIPSSGSLVVSPGQSTTYSISVQGWTGEAGASSVLRVAVP